MRAVSRRLLIRNRQTLISKMEPNWESNKINIIHPHQETLIAQMIGARNKLYDESFK